MNNFVVLCLFVTSAMSQDSGLGNKISDNLLLPIQISPSKGYPWPLPQNFLKDLTYFSLDPENFEFLLVKNCSILESAIKRYRERVFLTKCAKDVTSPTKQYSSQNLETDKNYLGKLNSISINVSGPCENWPYMNMDEQYSLKVNASDMPNQILLFSTTVWGALRGLETFSHLVYTSEFAQFCINTTKILDNPRFPYRGLLLDTARHFIPVSILLQNLDAMSQVKLNVFHWHIVDDPSFPFVSSAFPNLSNKGAFNPETHIYSPSDVANVIEYARLRGIRVVSEFNTPGHTQSWGKGQPGLLTPFYSNLKPDGTYGPINPANLSNYNFLETFFGEVAKKFPDDYIHLGGDEVNFNCWMSNPDVNLFMTKQLFPLNYQALTGYYMRRLVEIVKSLNKSCIVWQEVFDSGTKVKNDTIIQVWKDPYAIELATVTTNGYRAILSSCWYLNYQYQFYGRDWPIYYVCDPHNFIGTEDQKKLVIGGEASMWGELVDGFSLMTRTWPRAAAVAERLWSDQSVKNVTEASPRLEELRCRMIKRGITAQPVNGPGFCECDYLM